MATPRSRGPELEHDVGRTPSLGYEPAGSYGSVRYLEHGFRTRWCAGTTTRSTSCT